MCVPPRSGSVGSLKRSAEGERNRGNTVRKGEVVFNIFLEMPACPERGGIAFKELRQKFNRII